MGAGNSPPPPPPCYASDMRRALRGLFHLTVREDVTAPYQTLDGDVIITLGKYTGNVEDNLIFYCPCMFGLC